MRAALRHLCKYGGDALKPRKYQLAAARKGLEIKTHDVWSEAKVSKRVGNDLRKQALREGTYGSFDAKTGVGWDPEWDLALKSNRYQAAQRYGGVRPKKKTSRERSRETRAQRIEEKLATQEKEIDEYFTNKEKARIKDNSFEARFKRMNARSSHGG